MDQANPFAAIFNQTLTKKEDVIEPFYIQAFEETTGSVLQADGTTKVIPSWRVRAVYESGEPLLFLMSRNPQRDTMVGSFKSLLARGAQPPLTKLVVRRINHKVVGESDMYEFELA